jgi:hypothetical protein
MSYSLLQLQVTAIIIAYRCLHATVEYADGLDIDQVTSSFVDQGSLRYADTARLVCTDFPVDEGSICQVRDAPQ